MLFRAFNLKKFCVGVFKLYFNQRKIRSAIHGILYGTRLNVNLLLRDLTQQLGFNDIYSLGMCSNRRISSKLVPFSFSLSIFIGFHRDNSRAREFIDRFRGALQNNSASISSIKIRVRKLISFVCTLPKIRAGSSRITTRSRSTYMHFARHV